MAKKRSRRSPKRSSKKVNNVALRVKVGCWSLLAGVLLALMIPFVDSQAVMPLIVVGFIIGFMNLKHIETLKFLITTMSFLIIAMAVMVTGMTRLVLVAPAMAGYLTIVALNIVAIVGPAAFVMAVKAMNELAVIKK